MTGEIERWRLTKAFQCRRHGRAGQPGCRLRIGNLGATPSGSSMMFTIAGTVQIIREEIDGADCEVRVITSSARAATGASIVRLTSATGRVYVRCRCGHTNVLDGAALRAIAMALRSRPAAATLTAGSNLAALDE